MPKILFFLLSTALNLCAQSIELPPHSSKSGNPKLESALWEAASAAKSSRKPLVLPKGLEATKDGKLIVFLIPEVGKETSSIDTQAVSSLRGDIRAVSRHFIRAAIPPEAMVNATSIQGVWFIQRPIRPVSQQVVSEGASSIKALANHARGVKGQGVKVAIIDGGFKGANRLSDDLPSEWKSTDYTNTGMYSGDNVHGTACAEVVYDIAPDAELYLLKADDLLEVENAKDQCIRDKVNIISFSNYAPGTGFGDGLGTACEIANDAADKGLLWVNSAGNFALSQYIGFWVDSDADSLFDNGLTKAGDPDEVLELVPAKADETIDLWLTWNDWPASAQDYDLYLVQIGSNGNLKEVASSTSFQGGSGGPPAEHIEYKVTTPGRYGVRVWKDSKARSELIKVLSVNHEFDTLSVTLSNPIFGEIGTPADAMGALSVGAIRYGNWARGPIESYSSRGPTVDGRKKPDLVAPTGVSTVSYGSNGFYGTSASAPNVAGAAALLKCANPTYTRSQLADALIATTVDLGDKGRDNVYGAGKLILPLLQAPGGPQVSTVSPQSIKYGETLTIRGQGFGTSRGTGRVVFKGSVQPATSDYVSWSDSEIRVRIPTGARKGEVLLITNLGERTTTNLTITSPWIGAITPTPVKTTKRITITGENFGTSRGTSSINIGSVVVPAASIATWSNAGISLAVPVNTAPGNVTVTTAQGRSNAVNLVISSPYLISLTPTKAARGSEVVLVGGNFGARRGTGYVMFGGVWAVDADYVSWGNSRITVKVPASARTAEVKAVTSTGESGSIRLEVEEEEVVYRLPYPGTLGYSPPAVTGNPKGVTFEFEGVGGQQWLVTFELGQSSAGEVALYKNGAYDNSFGVSGSADAWLYYAYRIGVAKGKNTIEFRNTKNFTRSSGYDNWAIRNVQVWKPFDAKRMATLGGQQLPLSSSLGNPYPSPFNSEVTVPFDQAQESPISVVVYDLAGQKIKTLFKGVRPAGTHLLVWDGRNEGGSSVASGVYLVVADTPKLRERKRVVLLR